MKRDGLMIEFFEVLSKAKTVRKELVEALLKAEQRLQMATAIDGTVAIGSVAYSLQKEPAIQLDSRNIMGVVVPKITAEAVEKKMYDRGYGIIGTSAAIDEAADAHEKLLDKIILAAEVETGMIRLLEDIDSTKRRVNALEFKVIPELKDTIKFISMALEEMERDNVVKLKMLKGKSQRRVAAEEAMKEALKAAAAAGASA